MTHDHDNAYYLTEAHRRLRVHSPTEILIDPGEPRGGITEGVHVTGGVVRRTQVADQVTRYDPWNLSGGSDCNVDIRHHLHTWEGVAP
ncbi:hypothetical protein ACGFYY_35405 [Streptomyces sp. NPDC048331]|uniref:hypothetical protein n=1 Tax=Streptomyces sp. NPDC048331 TaxID=3365534 RepID=UPI0037114689